ncbi:hypothetical protein N2W54_003775 [Lotmaria passim]
MVKKQSRRGSNAAAKSVSAAAATAADSADVPRPPLTATTTAVTAHAALQSALERLDAIAREAHTYTQQARQAKLEREANGNSAAAVAPSAASTQGHKRPRVEEVTSAAATAALAAAQTSSRLDVFAVTSALQYQTLCCAVATFGLQLLPSLEDISKRVTLAVLTPALSTPEAWETFAVLCSTYRAGMAQAVNEVVESLLREPGVLLIDAPQLVPAWYAKTHIHVWPGACATNAATVALGGLLAFAEEQKMRDASAADSTSASFSPMLHLARVHTDRVARKLRALMEVVYAVGDYVPASSLQQLALRHAMEVMEGGVLPCYRGTAESGEDNVAAFKATDAENNSSASASEHSRPSEGVLRWRVPPAWHAVCVQLLEAFLFTIRPAVPAQLLVSAARVIDVVSGRLHRGVPTLSHGTPWNKKNDGERGGVRAETQDPSLRQNSEVLTAPPLPVTHAVSAAVVRLGHVLHLLHHPVVLAPYQPPQLTMEKAKLRVWSVAAATTTAKPNSAEAEESQSVTATSSGGITAPVLTAAAAAVVQGQREVAVPAERKKAPEVKPAPVTRHSAPPVVARREATEDEDDIPDIVLDD